MSSTEQLKISLQEILSATNRFAEENIIGRGGYGVVYRGRSKQHGVLAIKRLNRAHGQQGDHEYGMEVTLLSKYKHENLVSLVGFCGEREERILVYKYEANQSLDKFLKSKDLSWFRRLEICLGAARGLRYLHNGESRHGHGVIHRDIKSSNILLDESWKAKIADFGLSKLALTNSADSVIFTIPCGTYGYVDPQILYGGITQKSDVYSFGVVLYEVLFGKLATIPGHLVDGRFTVEMAKRHYEQNTLHMMIDPDLKNQMNSDSLAAFSTIAYRCIKDVREDRPTMSLVVEALEQALRYQPTISIRKRIGLSTDGFMYDVYISSVASNSTDSLCDALKREGLSIYQRDEYSNGYSNEWRHGWAINQSRSFIIMFTNNFSSNSLWNLEEIKEIMKCQREKGTVVLPLYYDVYPSDARKQFNIQPHALLAHKKTLELLTFVAATTPGLQLSDFNDVEHDLVKEAASTIKRQLSESEKELGCSHSESTKALRCSHGCSH